MSREKGAKAEYERLNRYSKQANRQSADSWIFDRVFIFAHRRIIFEHLSDEPRRRYLFQIPVN